MKFKELIDNCDDEKVAEALADPRFDLSDNEINNHMAVLQQLKSIEPTESNFTICVSELEDEWGSWFDVTGLDVELKEAKKENDYTDEELKSLYGDLKNVSWALEFRPWQEWLAMDVFETTLAMFDHDLIIAACLWEMTFISFEETKIQDYFDEIQKRVDEIKNKTEEEYK